MLDWLWCLGCIFFFLNRSYKLKVSKSQKQFLESSLLPKNDWKSWKNYPKSSQDNFFVFRLFLEELIIPKIAFEIHWPLIVSYYWVFGCPDSEALSITYWVCCVFCRVSWQTLQPIIQEVPAFHDFWYQKGITKFGDHEFWNPL